LPSLHIIRDEKCRLGIANSGGPGLLFQGPAGFGTRIQIMGPGTLGQGFIGSPEFQGLFAN
jgi:hypothetical protein